MMFVHTDNLDFAAHFFPGRGKWQPYRELKNPGLDQLAASLQGDRPVHSTMIESDSLWQYLFMVEKAPVSQYDVVVGLCQQNVDLPDGVLCLAGSGEKFHGLRNRSWSALPGNIHLTAHLRPDLDMAAYGIGFTVISALAVVEAIDRLPGMSGRAMIKWVNDIYIDDAKVSGFLTHTVSIDGIISAAVIGIGLNVETAPDIVPDGFVGRAAALNEFTNCNQRIVFENLIEALQHQYRLLKEGGLPLLLIRYRDRSLIMGREVEIVPDSPHQDGGGIIRGRVTGIGENLELFFENRSRPVTRGRLRFIS